MINYFEADRRTIKIEVTNKAEVNVYYPKSTSIKYAQNFVIKKQAWIEKKRREILCNISNNADIFDFKSILLLGEKIEITYEDINKISLINRVLVAPKHMEKDINALKKGLKAFISKFAAELLPQCMSYFSEIIGKSPAKIAISHPRSIWGSCNDRKEMRLNAKLVMLPKELMEYVVIHELCHLKELNHSEIFWREVNKFCDASYCRKQLKEYNYLITLF